MRSAFFMCWTITAVILLALPVFPAEEASDTNPAAKRKFDALGMIWQDLQGQEAGTDSRKELLNEFLIKSKEYLALVAKEDSSAPQIWTFRALAACELGRADEAKTAGAYMQELGLEKSPLPIVTRAFAFLERKGWLVDPKEVRAKEEADRKRLLEAQNAKDEWSNLLKKVGGQKGTFVVPDLNITMIPVAPGTFVMGAQGSDDTRVAVTAVRGNPSFPVKLTKGYWLGKTEVTEGQWVTLMGTSFADRIIKYYSTVKVKLKNIQNNRYGNASGDPSLAASWVSWNDAKEFCTKLNLREAEAQRLPLGYTYTLPTEAQWEMACRAGTQTIFHFGNDPSALDAYCSAVMFDKSTMAFWVSQVQLKKPNAWGFHDMEGNVWELCLDIFEKQYPNYAAGSDGFVENPVHTKAAETSVQRACRGGATGGANGIWVAQSDARHGSYFSGTIGFRIALVRLEQ